MTFYAPDFQAECRLCGTSPCVVVLSHPFPDTDLCGVCFFNSAEMLDWTEWNLQKETEDAFPESN